MLFQQQLNRTKVGNRWNWVRKRQHKYRRKIETEGTKYIERETHIIFFCQRSFSSNVSALSLFRHFVGRYMCVCVAWKLLIRKFFREIKVFFSLLQKKWKTLLLLLSIHFLPLKCVYYVWFDCTMFFIVWCRYRCRCALSIIAFDWREHNLFMFILYWTWRTFHTVDLDRLNFTELQIRSLSYKVFSYLKNRQSHSE